MTDRVDLDEDGQLDDLVLNNIELVRLERMSEDHVWMAFHYRDQPGKQFVVNIGVNNSGELKITHYED